MKKQSAIIIVVFGLFSCRSVSDQAQEEKGIVYSNVTIIDGLGNDPFVGSIIIEDSLIVKVTNDNESFSGYEIIDSTGKFVIPGLINTHVHATVLSFDSKTGYQSGYDKKASLQSLRQMLRYGVMQVRSVAGSTEESLELKKEVYSNKRQYPSIYTSGPALNKSNHPPFKAITNANDAIREIDQQFKKGVDIIKVYASLEPHLVKLVVEEAHRRNLKVVGHLQRTNWTQASNMGIDFITHAAPWSAEYLPIRYQARYQPTMKGRLDWIEFVDYDSEQIQEMISAMKINNVMFDPTLIAFHTKFWAMDSTYRFNPEKQKLASIVLNMWETASFVEEWTENDFIRAQHLWKKLIELTYRIYQAGIPITVGTDFPNPWIYPGLSVHKEMQLLQEAGIPTIDVIKMATYNGAIALGIENRTGSIEKRKLANLIFLNSDPVANIQNTLDIAWILREGEKID